ncbi:MAG: NTP transferase domain-containing protein [Rhodobacteraceae bacterium]|nr:NTP transferase domain-containing protein [Paracoccaceae bacterium]
MSEQILPSHPSARLAGVVLTGGLPNRMGDDDKFLLPLGGVPLLARVLARISPQVEGVVICTNGPAARLSGFELPVVNHSIGEISGPLAGVLTGMDWAAAQGFSHIVSVPADSPFFPLQLVRGLQFACEVDGARLAMVYSSRPKQQYFSQPGFALYDVGLRENLRESLLAGVRKVIEWSEPLGCARIVFEDMGEDPFFSIDTSEDMALAQARI